MSSVKDRIRNLQQSTATQPTKSVAERAQAVERVSEPNVELQQPLSQLKKRFDSNASRESSGGLGARVARFDSDTSQSLKDRVRELESGSSDIGSLAARASAFEHSGSGVKDAVEQFSDQVKRDDDDNTVLHKARAMFEAGSQDASEEQKLPGLKTSSADASKNVDSGDVPANARLAKPSEPKPPPSTTSQEAVTDGVSHRAAIFERGESESGSDEKSTQPTQRAPPRLQHVAQSTEKEKTVDARTSTESKATDERSVRDELREVKQANEELVTMLLELTAAFKRLEATRDELQKKVTALEKK